MNDNQNDFITGSPESLNAQDANSAVSDEGASAETSASNSSMENSGDLQTPEETSESLHADTPDDIYSNTVPSQAGSDPSAESTYSCNPQPSGAIPPSPPAPGQNSYWEYPGPAPGAAVPPPPPPAGSPLPPAPFPQKPRRKMSGSLKVFFWILGTLTVGLILAFGVYSILEWDHFHEPVPDGGTTQSQPYEPDIDGGLPENSLPTPNQPEQEPEAPEIDPENIGIQIQPVPSSDKKTADEIYEQLVQSVVGVNTTVTGDNGQQETIGQGTGIVATSDGYIITNSHVIYNSRNYAVQIILHDGSSYDANVVGFDKATDVAILKIDAQGLVPAVFGDVNDMKVGHEVLAIGNPGGMSYAGSLTGGYISALNRKLGSEDIGYIQTDAAINPGNSGGPLVNMYGQVIGINTSKIVSTQYEGMGFSIPIVTVKDILNDLIRQGYVANRARLGITAQNLSSSGNMWNSELPGGVVIVSINEESSFSGIAEEGDIITKMDGEEVSDMDDLYAILARHKGGDVVTVEIYHRGTSREEQVTLLEDKGETQQTP